MLGRTSDRFLWEVSFQIGGTAGTLGMKYCCQGQYENKQEISLQMWRLNTAWIYLLVASRSSVESNEVGLSSWVLGAFALTLRRVQGKKFWLLKSVHTVL